MSDKNESIKDVMFMIIIMVVVICVGFYAFFIENAADGEVVQPYQTAEEYPVYSRTKCF